MLLIPQNLIKICLKLFYHNYLYNGSYKPAKSVKTLAYFSLFHDVFANYHNLQLIHLHHLLY